MKLSKRIRLVLALVLALGLFARAAPAAARHPVAAGVQIAAVNWNH